MRVLVTGATGRVGGAVVSELLARGHTVRALTRTPSTASLPDGVEVVAGDLTDPPSLDGVFDGIDAAHLFAVGADDVEDPDAHVAEILHRASPVPRLTVLNGTGTVALSAAVVATGGTDIAPVEFMSNAMWWADDIREHGVVREVEGPSTVVHEADIAAVATAALTGGDEHVGATHVITGPEALTVRERVTLLAEVSGRTIRVEEPTEEELLAQWRSWGLSEEVIAQFQEWSTNPPEVGSTPTDTVERITGRPARTFAQWATENAASFR